MPEGEVLVSIRSNNPQIEKIFLDNNLHPEIKFVSGNNHKSKYKIFFIDLSSDLTQISQKLIDTYGTCRLNNDKLALVILHSTEIDIEKNHYFQRMLDDLGKDKPLHRQIFTKDIYQSTLSEPVSPFDNKLYKAVIERKITISEKGENLNFPLSIDDLINALIKTLFLSNTSGKNFWIIGDSILDLDLAYLLKKYLASSNQEELEINAIEKNNPKTNSLLSISTKSRAELNWQPENEIEEDLKRIVENYSEEVTTVKVKHSRENPLLKFLNWIYKPRQKKNQKLPTIRKIIQKICLFGLVILVLLVGSSVISTGISLQQLEKSVNQALGGNLNQSVNSLNTAIKLKEVGESTFAPIAPVFELIDPSGTEKIFNLYKFIDYSASSLGNLQQTYVMAENLLQSLNSTDSKINYDDLGLALHSNLSQVYENLTQISLLTGGNKLPSFVDKKISGNPSFNNLKTLEDQVAQFIKVTDIFPKILSGDKAKNIFVLLQNSQIQQPNGGNIDYYLNLSLDRGRIVSKQYFTPTEISNLAQIQTPTILKNKKTPIVILPTLQDLAQNPDFSKASSDISQYIEKILKMKPDFVIATNDLLIQQILIEENTQTVDSFRSDIQSASGSAGYKALFDQNLEKLFNQGIPLPVIGRTIAKMVGDNQILIWAADPSTESLIGPQSYSGAITLHPCNAGLISTEKCTAQTSYLSESSTTNSRQSPWSSRLINHTIDISTASVTHQYQVDYKTVANQGSATSIPTIYHLYLPSPSVLNQVLLNGLPSSVKDVIKTENGALDYYKIPLALTTGMDNTIIIKAATNFSETFTTPFSYSITEYRQPGTIDPGISLRINFMENLQPTVATSAFFTGPQQIKLDLPPHTSTFGFTLDRVSR